MPGQVLAADARKDGSTRETWERRRLRHNHRDRRGQRPLYIETCDASGTGRRSGDIQARAVNIGTVDQGPFSMSAWLEGHSNDGHDDKLAASLSASPKADTTTNDKQQGPSSSEYLTTSSVPSTVAPPAPLTIPSYYDQQVQLPSMHPIGTPSVATSTDTDSRALSSQSFPFRLQTLARRWAHVIPRDAIIDFASVDDAIAQQYDIVDSLVRKGIDTYSKDHLQATYEISRTAVGEAVFRAATIVSNTLDKAKRKGLAGADDRLAYKEYAELHQQALTYLINRINAFLERFDRVVPNLIRRHMHGKLWPIQQMANINHFVEMAHQPGWVAGSAEHQQQPVEAAHPPHQRHRSPIVLFDVDAISSGTLFLCMAIGFLFLVNAAQVSVQFTIRTVGVSQPTYTALLLTCAWPIYVTAMVLARYRTGRSMAIAPILMARAVILGAIEASAALFIAYSLHAMTLFAYQIVFTACHIAMSTSITGNAWPKERLFSVRQPLGWRAAHDDRADRAAVGSAGVRRHRPCRREQPRVAHRVRVLLDRHGDDRHHLRRHDRYPSGGEDQVRRRQRTGHRGCPGALTIRWSGCS